jgi:hypothetical protein
LVVTGVETEDGGFLFVPGQILMTEQARDFLPEIAGDEYHDITPDGLSGLGILLLSYTGSELLPEKVDALEASAQEAAAALKAITHDDVIDPAACKVDLHYVFSGEGYLYHGGPATSPGPATPGWSYSVGWGQPGDPQLVVLDTGVAVETSLAVLANVDADAVDDIDRLVPPGSNGGTLGAEAGHGTFIAALAARISEGLVRIGVRQVLDPDGYCTEVDLVTALKELRLAHPVAPTHPCGVINLSLGAYTQHDREPLWLGAELLKWRHRGAVVVAAAGNNGKAARPYWPAAGKGVVAVASVTFTNGVAEASVFSNRGN